MLKEEFNIGDLVFWNIDKKYLGIILCLYEKIYNKKYYLIKWFKPIRKGFDYFDYGPSDIIIDIILTKI